MLYVKELEEKDLDTIEQMDAELYVKPWKKKDFLYEIKENDVAYYFKMENSENNEIIGYIGFWILFEKAEITKVSIDKKYQGHHLASILLDDALRRMTLAECESVTLEVRVSNTRAINLYTKHGFKTIATRKKYYDNGEDAYLMIKELNNDDNTSD